MTETTPSYHGSGASAGVASPVDAPASPSKNARDRVCAMCGQYVVISRDARHGWDHVRLAKHSVPCVMTPEQWRARVQR